jgi:hypothetical protein
MISTTKAMVRLSFFAMAMFANLAMSVAGPINTETYRELTNGFGQTGACRGNGGGGDRVDSRYRILTTQTACETVCDDDSDCVAYAYKTGTGDCVIYGSGQDGSCSLSVDTGELDRYHNFQSCGECTQDGAVVEDALTKSLCGICSKETPAALVASLGVCSTVGGLWTEATWTAGTWEEPLGGWVGDSYTHQTQYGSTNVHTITIADGYGCFDKVHEDGQPTCNGSTAGNSSCQTAFEDRRTSTQCPVGCTFYPRNGSHGPYCDGLASDGETSCIEGFETTDVFSEESCLAIDSQCVYVPAIEWTTPPADIHAPPSDLGPGWQEVIKASETTGDCTGRDNLPQCKGKDNIAGFIYGVCRLDTVGALNGENVNQKYCKNCINTNGDQVNLDEKACAQACLDDPSGSCMGFSHADNANCILYGVDGEHYLRHPGDVENEWLGYALHDEPCLADKIPIGCTPNFNTIKMNTKFLCRHLNQDNTRWLAWGEATGSEEITVELTVTPSLSDPVGVEDFTQEMMDELRIKMASIAFVDADKDVSLEIGEGDQDGHVKVTFAIQVPSNVIIPMTGMLNTILVSKSRDGALYFHSKITTDNALKNAGTLIPMAGHIAGILVKGMRHNLVDKSKELQITSWSELSPSACSVDPVDPPVSSSESEVSCPDVICEECNVASSESSTASSGALRNVPAHGIAIAALMYNYLHL